MEDNSSNNKNKKKEKNDKRSKKSNSVWNWTIKVFFLAFALSMFFGILSELFMSGTGIVFAILMVFIFIAIAVATDMVGVAVLACDEAPFKAMASRKVKGAKQGLYLIKNSAKIASLCADVVGDVCGILSGAAGASIVAKITIDFQNANLAILVASLITAFIAGVTIFGKALGKRKAMDSCNSIILKVGKVLSLFTKQPKNKKKKQEDDKSEVEK